MATKKILELCLSPDLGGLELYMVRASHYLNAFSVINKSGKLEQYYKNTEYKYSQIGRFSFMKLARLIDENDIDIIHLHWTKDIPIAVLAKLLSRKKPKLVQTRNMMMTRFKDDFYHKFLYKHMDLMLAVTHQVQEQIEKFVPADIRPYIEILYMGAETPMQITLDERKSLRQANGITNEFVIGIVGRIEEAKGQHLVLQASKEMQHHGMKVKVLVVGHAMDEEYLNDLKERYADLAIFTGFTQEAQKYMQLCDTLVLATRNETFGLVVIEAMMCGVSVVVSDSGGPLEIIDHLENGLHFKTSDFNDLIEKLTMLYCDSELKEKLAKAGQQKALEAFESRKQFERLKCKMESL